MTHFYYWEDFYKGQTFVCGPLEISAQDITEFARQYDPQRFHMSAQEAQNTHFKGLIASGWQTGALMMRMVCDAFLVHSSSLGSPGLDSLQWLKPVRPNDRLKTVVEVLETRPLNSKPHLGIVSSRWQCFNQNEELTTTLTASIMFHKRPTEIN